ncbi:DNA repair exonuclease [bacterium]|nr:DNA repair exonuclease [bacterium]
MPPQDPVRILFVGDMHLGRRAARVPASAWRDHGLADDLLTPASSWRRCVETALSRGVDAVALAGDLVHDEDDVFEARGRLEEGLRRLTGAGIRVCAVAGNHDTRVLPALADVLDDLVLLGRDGTWDTCPIAPHVRLAGWSFPARHHAESPLRGNVPAAVPGVVTIGLLHADRDAPGSRYAPVTAAELDAAGYDGWALGHVHAPDPVPAPGEHRPFYLGSVAATTPNETGVHGPVLASVADGVVVWERLALAPLRWEHRAIRVDGFVLPDDGEVGPELLLQLMPRLARAEDGAPGPDLLGLRVTLTGVHTRAADIARWVAGCDRDALTARDADGTVVFVEKLTADVGTPVDLVALAARSDPPGLLAGRILALERGDPALAPLLEEARRAVNHIDPDADDDDEALRRELAAAGRRALDALLAQTREVRP